jgi:hypothetical protein
MKYDFSYQPRNFSGTEKIVKEYVRQLSNFLYDNCEHSFENLKECIDFMQSLTHWDSRLIEGFVRIQATMDNGMIIANARFKLKEVD